MTTSGNSTPWIKAILIMFYSCLVTQARIEGMIKECFKFIHKHRQEILGWFSSCLFSRLHKLKSSYLSFGLLNQFLLRVRYRRTVVASNKREFEKLLQLLQRKFHTKFELRVSLSILGLFHVCHVVRNSRSTPLLAWHKWISCNSKEWKIYRCRLVCRQHLKRENVALHLVHYVRNCTKKGAARAARLFFNQSNHYLWRCHGRYRRQVLNSLMIY